MDRDHRAGASDLSDFSADTLPAFEVLPRFPRIRPRAMRRMMTRQLLELRIRQLEGRGFGWSYYAPRAFVYTVLVLLVVAAAGAAFAVGTGTMSPSSPLYGVRRALETARLEGAAPPAAAEGALWQADRRIHEAAVITGTDELRGLLRDAEAALVRMDDGAAALPAVDRARLLARGRAVEEQAAAFFAGQTPTLAARLPGADTWVVPAERDIPPELRLAHTVRTGAPSGADPQLTASLAGLFAAAESDPSISAIVPRLRDFARDGSPFLPADAVEAYARFLLTQG